jgi:hypothetical protein
MYYLKNLQNLRNTQPLLVKKLYFHDAISIFSNSKVTSHYLEKNQTYTFELVSDQGQSFYSTSIYDTKYETETFFENFNFDNKGYVMLGASSPELLMKLLREKVETAYVIVIEKDIEVLRKLFELFDFSSYLVTEYPRIAFFCGEEEEVKKEVQDFLSSTVLYSFLKPEFIRVFATYQKDKEYYNSMFTYIKNLISDLAYLLGNDLNDTLIGIENNFENLNGLILGPKLRDFQNKYKNKPIFVVSSGPSLDKNAHLLKEAKGKGLIICAESTLKALLRKRIEPDIVCVIERVPTSYELSIKGVNIPEKTALFALAVVEKRIFDYWNQYKTVVLRQNEAINRWINQMVGNVGGLIVGDSVAHMAFALAQYLGGSPIVLVGQDLAYSDEGHTHSSDTEYINSEQQTDPEMKEFVRNILTNEDIFINKPVFIDGYYGGKVKSKELWVKFLRYLEWLIQLWDVTCINATEGGAKIKGTINMPLHEVINQYCTEEITPITTIFDALMEEKNGSDKESEDIVKNVFYEFAKIIKEMKEIQKDCDSTVEFSTEFLKEISEMETLNYHQQIVAEQLLTTCENIIGKVMNSDAIHHICQIFIALYHSEINPIFRINSVERLRKILAIQNKFLSNISLAMTEATKTLKSKRENIKEQFKGNLMKKDV